MSKSKNSLEHGYDYDICVIGAGPGGFAAAVRAWDFGKRVALIEKNQLGGSGVHNGALTSKTWWELSRDYLNAVRTDRGYRAENISLNYLQIVSCVESAVDEKVAQMATQLSALSEANRAEPTEKNQGSITLLRGTAAFEDPHSLCVKSVEAGQSQTITAENIVIATGSKPRELNIAPTDGVHILTSDHIMHLTDFPRSMVIVGAGVVGCEFATIFANYGKTQVHLIDQANRILPFEDEDISRICSTNLEQKGVTIHHEAQLQSLQVVDGQIEYIIQHPHGGNVTIYVDKALISIGRVPNTSELGLKKASVELSDRGDIVNNSTQTSVPHIYAVGDATRDIALVNVAEIEARYAVERMYEEVTKPLSYHNISTIMFLAPEVAAVGLNEQQAQKQKIPYKVAVYGYPLVNRAIAMRATEGFVKLLVTDDDQMKVLGMRALGVHASTTIEAVSLMIQHGRSIRDLAELIHPHPAVTEAVQECVRMLLGNSIYKPQVFQGDLRLAQFKYDE